MPAGARLWLSGWTKTIGGRYGAEFVSLSATIAKPRERQPLQRRRAARGTAPNISMAWPRSLKPPASIFAILTARGWEDGTP
jgi:hypothetical protein